LVLPTRRRHSGESRNPAREAQKKKRKKKLFAGMVKTNPRLQNRLYPAFTSSAEGALREAS
jgi:hypothetical protein